MLNTLFMFATYICSRPNPFCPGNTVHESKSHTGVSNIDFKKFNSEQLDVWRPHTQPMYSSLPSKPVYSESNNLESEEEV